VNPTFGRIANALLFQALWWGCVAGGASWGAIGLAGMVACNAWFGTLRRDLPLVIALGIGGWLLDSAWAQVGVLDFGSPYAPPWIAMLWCGVALALNQSLAWFQSRPATGAALAAICAPFTYLAGQQLGAVLIPDVRLMAVIAVVWAGVFYVAFSVARQRGDIQ
jgi:hypothetical protein